MREPWRDATTFGVRRWEPETALLRRHADRGNGIEWEDFTTTSQGARMIAQHGQEAAQEVFARISGDGWLTAVDAYLSGAVDAGSALDNELIGYAKSDLIEDAVARRIVPTRGGDHLRREMAKAGLLGRPKPTGYIQHGEGSVLTELQIRELDRPGVDTLLRSPALTGSIARTFGADVAWESLHHDFDGAARVLTVSREEARPAPVPEPLDVPADFITHHNQALESWRAAKQAGIIGEGNVLVHLDSHSDIYTLPSPGTCIADFVNASLEDGTVSEVYWVVPDTMKPVGRAPSGPLYLTAEPGYDVKLWAANGCVTPERPESGTPSREVTVHVRRMDQVPVEALAQAGHCGRGLLLDVDLDFFSNSGHDSDKGTVRNASKAELYGDLERFALFAEQLAPSFVTTCMSPEYTSRDDRATLRDFAGALFPGNLIPDRAGAYSLGHNPDLDTMLTNMLEEIALPDTREFSPTLRDELCARGFPGLASSYERYCTGIMSRAAFLEYVERESRHCPS